MPATKVSLEEVATGHPVEAELHDGITDDHLALWEATWKPAVDAGFVRLKTSGVPQGIWPRDTHWKWRELVEEARQYVLTKQTFALTANGELQGLMRVDLTKTGLMKSQVGKDLVYVDYLVAAPWNRKDLGGDKRYTGVGTTLMWKAINVSIENKFKGRVGLHSLADVESFYSDVCGMAPLFKDPSFQNLKYFEMTPDQAQEYLNDL